jgi:molybdopterin-guanine dinucleotide biosynthesis protein A
VGDRPMIDHVASSLTSQSDTIIIVGRSQKRYHCVADIPASDMRPPAGIAGAFTYAAEAGFPYVFSVGVDALRLPNDLRQT